MTLAEALILRSDMQKKIMELENRLMQNIKVQEGDKPALEPEEIKLELFDTINELTCLIQRINKTNNITKFNEELMLAEALSIRDGMMQKINILKSVMNDSSVMENRYSPSEIKFVSVVNIKSIKTELDDLSKEWRELDTEIQKLNWNVDLIE